MLSGRTVFCYGVFSRDLWRLFAINYFSGSVVHTFKMDMRKLVK